MPVKKRKSKVKEVKVGRLIQAPGKGKRKKKAYKAQLDPFCFYLDLDTK